MGCEIWPLNGQAPSHTARLEGCRGRWNCRCSGEMHRDRQEHPGGNQPTGHALTLRCESVGSELDYDTRVVHAANDATRPLGAVTRSGAQLTRKWARLGTTSASLKLKGIDGARTSSGACGLISTQRAEPYP